MYPQAHDKITKTNMAGVQCFGCGVEFSFFKREHSCKNCNRLFCSGCTSKSAVIEPGTKKERVCDQCYRKLAKGGVQKDSTQNKPDGKLNDLDKISQQQNHGYQERGKDKGFYMSLDKNIPPTEDNNENINPDPDKELRERLSNLKNGPGGSKTANDEELGQRFSQLTGRTATCMQKSDINTPKPKKTEGEQVDDLLKKMMSENQIDDQLSAPAGNDQITVGEIEERLAKLKGIDPEVFKNPQVNWDNDEDEETQTKKYLKQVLTEAMLEDKTESMGIDISKKKPPSKSGKAKHEGKTSNVPQASGTSSSIWDKDYEADSDDDELPWCCICNANAVLRCQGCDNDLYCKRCYREGHSRADFEDHPTTAYKPPKKQR